MLYKFKSRATADVIMLEPNGRQIVQIMGKTPGQGGIVTAEQIPGAIAAIEAAIVAEERARNIHVGDGIDEQTFVDKRTARDATLDMPRLILPSLQVNMKAGRLPEADTAGKRFLKVPINGL